mmetsp:Transcript_21977/g.49126  ORF Transcript_21977/g.49126 Transcript_21977/m.49126 type:complete len:100 (+) Transcript_21977:1495-1794(+)
MYLLFLHILLLLLYLQRQLMHHLLLLCWGEGGWGSKRMNRYWCCYYSWRGWGAQSGVGGGTHPRAVGKRGDGGSLDIGGRYGSRAKQIGRCERGLNGMH